MAPADDLESRLAHLIEHHLAEGTLLPVDAVTTDRPDLAAPLTELVRQYLAIAGALDAGDRPDAPRLAPSSDPALSLTVDGFRTIERLGAGGMGEVYKLHDLALNRTVAAKVVRRDSRQAARLADFLREARSLALFSDPRIVRIFEFRATADPPVIIMELVEGFELGQIGRSLEFRQRAKVLHDVCEAIHHAHTLGIQHRDLKPSNIMLDGTLLPKILDFGLSDGNPSAGHLRGTLHYIAPEQLDPTQPIDARTDVYALGVIFYELLTGAVPYTGASEADVVAAIRAGHARLPVEIDSRVPEALQRIALKAMARAPADRYPSAREMSLDLGRYLDGLPVMARPALYDSTLSSRVRPHREAIDEWSRLQIIYPHEATRLHRAYQQLSAREDDWIVAGRVLSYSQIALYLGAFLLFAGSIFYFFAHRVERTVHGLTWPLVVLGVPFLGLTIAGNQLYRRDHRAVGVAFSLAGLSVLPLFLFILFYETGAWVVPAETPGQLFTDGSVSNRQLQVTVLLSAAWAGWLAAGTRTVAFSTVFAVLTALLAVAVLADFGLREWIDAAAFDRLALRLWPLAALYAAMGAILDRRQWTFFATPLFVASTVTLIATLDLLALDGKMLGHLGLSVAALQPATVSNPALMDTAVALTLNGVAWYVLAVVLERRGTATMAPAGQLLAVIAPFSMLEPLAALCGTGEYSRRIDWLYLAFAIGIAVLSRHRQRKSFYYAGLVNTGLALYFIADHRQWFDDVGWAVSVILAGLGALTAGLVFAAWRRRKGP